MTVHEEVRDITDILLRAMFAAMGLVSLLVGLKWKGKASASSGERFFNASVRFSLIAAGICALFLAFALRW